ncbi:MAG: TonB-dependent receptor [Saprospiraceae bacterium]|nr:TonB-dependent receptor [Saprospiraceae bacterium]
MKILKILLVIVMAQVAAIAQEYAIKGQIQDHEKNNLTGAVVVGLNPVDSVMLSYTVTDENGKFQMTDVNKGKIRLQITYIGFGTLEKTVELTPQQKILDLGIIKMLQEGAMLDAVTISAEYVPIKITKDTLEFTADAFKTQPNAVVEDLLKKLPGVEVEADGTIKVKGEEVKAVTVDGKDFFGKDPKMATRNLPANAVKKVQVFEKKSKNAEFTGVSDGQEETTINLELKEDRRNGFFGNASAGVGTDSRYEGKTMMNRFSGKTQLSFIGTLNNLNNTGISAADFGSMTGSSGRNMNMNTGAPINFGQNNNGETNSATLGVNLNNLFGVKNRINFSYFLTQSGTDLTQNTFTNSFLPTGALISNKYTTSNTNTLNHNFYSALDFRIDSTSEMNVTGNLAIRDNDRYSTSSDSSSNVSNVLLNRNEQKRDNSSVSNNYGFTLNFRKRLKKRGRTITFDSGIGNNTSESLNQVLSEVYGRNLILNTKSSVFQDQEQLSANNNYNLGATYTEPLSSTAFLTTSISQRNNKTDLIKDFFNLDRENTELRTLNEELSRTFDNSFKYTTAGTNIRFNKENYSFSAGLDYQNSSLKGLPSVGEKIDRSFNYFLPKFNLELDKLNLRINYSTSIREPSMDQLQPVLDNTDPLNLYQGSPNLIPEYRHSMRLMYHHFDQFTFRSLFANVRLGYTKNRITTSSFFDPELFIRTQNPVNTDSEKSMSTSLSFSSPLNVIKAKYRINLNSSITNGINFINRIENDINRWTNGGSFTLENKSKNKIDISATTRLSYTQNIYKENESLNTDFLNQSYETYFAWFAGKGWTLDSRYDINLYGQGSFGASTTIQLWQASISKNFLDNKINTKLRVFDILNQNQGVSRTASETNISESVSNSIGQYFMLSCTYNINALGAPKQPSRMDMMHRM